MGRGLFSCPPLGAARASPPAPTEGAGLARPAVRAARPGELVALPAARAALVAPPLTVGPLAPLRSSRRRPPVRCRRLRPPAPASWNRLPVEPPAPSLVAPSPPMP